MDLRRRTYIEERPKADEEYLTAAQLRERISQPVPYCFGKEYSKLSAIARIAAAVSDGESLTEDAGRQLAREVQWLLADRGILFAQTRTRHYPPRYNWQISVQAQASLPPSARERGDWWEPYEDTLACNRDLEKYQQMVDRNARWDQEKVWATWKTAAPAIQEYLHPETLWGMGEVKAAPVINRGIEETEEKFTKTFQTYLEGVGFQWHMTRSTGNPEDAPWSVVADRCWRNDLWGQHQKKAADPSGFVLMQHPGVIFCLLRSPSCLMEVVHAESRKRNVWKVMEKACGDVSMPVTAQTWWLDKPLLEGIIDACETGCNSAGLPFQRNVWDAFVECLEYCVESVSFSMDALYELRGLWKNLLKYCTPGELKKVYQPLDKLLEKRYEGKDASRYLTALWRRLKAPGNAETWQKMVQQYRQAFENPVTEEEKVREILYEILYETPPFGWNKIPLKLRDEECAQLKEQLPEDLAKRVIMQIDARVRDHYALAKAASAEKAASAKEGKAKSKGDRHMELFVLEWALLQTICGQSVQELLGSAAVLAKYVPFPEKQPGAK